MQKKGKIVNNSQIDDESTGGRGKMVIQKLCKALTHEESYGYAAEILLSGYAILSEMKNAWLTSRRRIGPI